ncbi:MAG TPA: hypothetical protein VHZ33_35865 [Trebonia sp.]|nr:hypothetical protein [Trebonia sp.]
MRVVVTVVCPASRRSTDVVLDADPATPMAAVAGAVERFAGGSLAAAPGAALGGVVPRPRGPGAAAGALYVDGQRIWQRLTLAESPIRDGCVISLGSPDGCVVPSPVGVVDILVAGGPDAGVIHRIRPGRADVGSGAAASVRIGDPAMPSRALLVHVNEAGGCQVAAYAGAAATLDRAPLGPPVPWLPGQRVAIGGTALGLAPCAAPDAALRPSADGGGLDFSRPPRRAVPGVAPSSGDGGAGGAALGALGALCARPSAEAAAGEAAVGGAAAADCRLVPIVMASLPLVVGLLLAFLLNRVYLLAMASLSPVLLIGGALGERWGGRRGERRGEFGGRVEVDAKAALEAELTARREQCPDPAAALGIASGPGRRLWERRRADPDFLLLRVGAADLPVRVKLAGREGAERAGAGRRRSVLRTAADAPVTIALAECGVLGVAGAGGTGRMAGAAGLAGAAGSAGAVDAGRAVGRWLVAQAAISHSPHDLRIYLLTDAAGPAGWEWVRWLPHCRPGPGGSCAVLVGNDPESAAARIAELLAIVTARQRVIRDGHQGVGSGPGIMVVLDGARTLRSLPGAGRLLAEGPPVGVYAICLDRSEWMLPAECQAVATFGRDGLLRVQQTTADTIDRVRADHADPGWCARVARCLAPIRDVSDDGGRRAGCGAGACRAGSASSAGSARDVWLASVGWAALGRPEPVPPAAELGADDDAAARSLMPG